MAKVTAPPSTTGGIAPKESSVVSRLLFLITLVQDVPDAVCALQSLQVFGDPHLFQLQSTQFCERTGSLGREALVNRFGGDLVFHEGRFLAVYSRFQDRLFSLHIVPVCQK